MTVPASGLSQPTQPLSPRAPIIPDATLTLTRPILTGFSLVTNRTFRVKAAGLLTMHGITRPVTFQATSRYSGSLLETAGSIPVVFSGWNVHAPNSCRTTACWNSCSSSDIDATARSGNTHTDK